MLETEWDRHYGMRLRNRMGTHEIDKNQRTSLELLGSLKAGLTYHVVLRTSIDRNSPLLNHSPFPASSIYLISKS